MAKKICLITGSRSEYDRQYWLIRDLLQDQGLDLQLVVTGTHLSKKFGQTIKQIEKDGLSIVGKVAMLAASDRALDIARSVGIGTRRFADLFAKLRPDLVLVYGDRFELLSVAAACVCMHIPIAHIAGGQITEGAIDDQIRHMLTKASHIHFVANNVFADRLRQLGEEPWRICVSGSPAIDSISRMKLLSRRELGKELGFDISDKTVLVTFHSVTLDLKNLRYQVDSLLKALLAGNKKFGLNYVITYPNADSGSYYIIDAIEKFAAANPGFIKLKKNLGQRRYLSLLAQIGLMVGNSSSGIVESPSFGIPAVNIGDRQKGRIFAKNIIQSGYSAQSILKGIKKGLGLKKKKYKNPYGKGKASGRIVKFISRVLKSRATEAIIRKHFVDLKWAGK